MTSAEVVFAGVGKPNEHNTLYRIAPVNLVFYGVLGECVQKYSGPAALQLQREGYVQRIAGIDLRAPSGELAFEDHCVNRALALPVHWLDDNEYLTPQTRHIVSVPSPLHAPLLTQLLAAGCRNVASEKPLTLLATDAQGLLGKSVHQISHQLAKAEMLRFIRACQTGLLALEQIGHFDFFLLEDVGVTPGRAVDNVICDMHWHGYEAMVAPLARLVGPGQRFRVVIEQVVAATYMGEPSLFTPARDWTLAVIAGRIFATHEITYRILAGKGCAQRDKRLVVKDRQGRALRTIPLVEEPRWRAHYRLLKELTTPVPDMLTTLEQAVGVVTLCEHSVRMAVDGGTYPFGSTPILEALV